MGEGWKEPEVDGEGESLGRAMARLDPGSEMNSDVGP